MMRFHKWAKPVLFFALAAVVFAGIVILATSPYSQRSIRNIVRSTLRPITQAECDSSVMLDSFLICTKSEIPNAQFIVNSKEMSRTLMELSELDPRKGAFSVVEPGSIQLVPRPIDQMTFIITPLTTSDEEQLFATQHEGEEGLSYGLIMSYPRPNSVVFHIGVSPKLIENNSPSLNHFVNQYVGTSLNYLSQGTREARIAERISDQLRTWQQISRDELPVKVVRAE